MFEIWVCEGLKTWVIKRKIVSHERESMFVYVTENTMEKLKKYIDCIIEGATSINLSISHYSIHFWCQYN